MIAAHRIQSLKGEKSFEKVFRSCRKFSDSVVSFHVQFVSGGTSQSSALARGIRVGIMVRKKNVHSAVHRNRIKRLIRESIRQCSAEQPQYLEGISAVIISWNTRIDADSSTPHLRDVRPAVESLLRQSQSFRERRIV